MITRQAIEKAIAGGWTGQYPAQFGKPPVAMFAFKLSPQSDVEEVSRVIHKGGNAYKVALDPSFWQGLGKALGWEMAKECPCCHKEYEYCRCDNCSIQEGGKYIEWQANARGFYDLILTGGDTKAYWQDILK